MRSPSFMISRSLLLLAGLTAWLVPIGCTDDDMPSANNSSMVVQPTFNKDIAPIIFEHCAACHRPGESAPFSLLTYRDASKRAEQIAKVTADRYMPPWLPRPEHGHFRGVRRLSDEQIDAIGRWQTQGRQEGDPADLPPVPQWPQGWQLGQPDLIVTMDEPYTLPASARDVFRTFVIPIPIESARYVKGLELRPGNPRIVHHAVVEIDQTPSSRYLDKRDPQPGFDGMAGSGESQSPPGFLVGWLPGKTPRLAPPGMAWRLEKKTDLIVSLHMLPSGKPEQIQVSAGFFFTDEPPTRFPFVFKIGSESIDISPGQDNYRISDHYVLPVDVQVLSIYPHAHYLGKQMTGLATLPDGTKKPLIQIDDWDFNWQDQYYYREPIFLPKGTTIAMQYRYDNSERNLRNPSNPPHRVTYGPGSSDEMGDLWLQVLPRTPQELAVLKSDYARKLSHLRIGGFKKMLEVRPNDWHTHNTLALWYIQAGRIEEAKQHFQASIRLADDYAIGRYNLGNIFQLQNQMDKAIDLYEQAIAIDPGYAEAYNNLGLALQAQGKRAAATEQFYAALRARPDFVDAHCNLGNALTTEGQYAKAIDHFEQAIRIKPNFALAHQQLGEVLSITSHPQAALARFNKAMQLQPDWWAPYEAAAWLLATYPEQTTHRPQQAVRLAQHASKLTSHRDAAVQATLATAYAMAGKYDLAALAADEAIALARTSGNKSLEQKVQERLKIYHQYNAGRQPVPEAAQP